MEAKALTVVTPRAFRSGETPHLKIATRNLETLTFTAYKLDAEAYFRKKHALRGRRGARHRPGRPRRRVDGRRSRATRKYKPIETTYDLKKLEVPGVYVVKVTDEKTLQATTLVLGSDLDAIVKASREQVLVFAQDMKTGKGRPGARVLVADGDGGRPRGEDRRRRRAAARLGQAARPEQPRSHYLVLDGDDVAGSGLGVPGQGRAGPDAAGLPLHRPAGLSARPGGRSCAGWSARSRTASTPTCPGRPIGWR